MPAKYSQLVMLACTCLLRTILQLKCTQRGVEESSHLFALVEVLNCCEDKILTFHIFLVFIECQECRNAVSVIMELNKFVKSPHVTCVIKA